MNMTIGLIGVLGFLAYESSYLIKNYRLQTKIGRILICDPRYYILIFGFSCFVFLVTSTFGVSDLNVDLLPPKWSNIKVFEALKSFGIGIATVHLYKTSAKPLNSSVRTETTKLEVKELTFSGVHSAWRRL